MKLLKSVKPVGKYTL